MNRLAGELYPLAPGKVTARGWIREQLLRNKDGMGGHLDELEPDMIKHPYLDRTTHDAWGEERKAGWGAEISGNYWYGLVLLAFTLDDESLKAKAAAWVDGALENQDSDGYLGTYTKSDDRFDDYNAWGTACGLSALMAYYEATERDDVLRAVHRCLLWFCENWDGSRKTRYAGQHLSSVMAWCHNYVPDHRLTRFIRDYVAFLNENDLYSNSQNAMTASRDIVYNSNHAATVGVLLRKCASEYMATGEASYLEAAKQFWEKIQRKVLLPTGGIASNTEYLSPITSVTETEYCTFSFLQSGLAWLGAATGDARCFDILERIAFNGAQGARKKDERCIAYFTSPNQIFATETSDHYGKDYGVYAPCHPVSCCPVTSVWTMPEHLHAMALENMEGDLYIATYGPARIDCGGLVLTTNTAYPFRDRIDFDVTSSDLQDRRVVFRVPDWCEDPSFSVNGQSIEGDVVDGWFAITKRWKTGDVIEVGLPRQVRMVELADDDGWRHHPMVFEYGALVFSLQIPEVWTPIKGRPRTPLPAEWSWYQVEPEDVHDDRGDVYEQNGLRKYSIGWNVAVNEHLDQRRIQVREHEATGYVWEHPMLTLRIPAYKALYSYAPYIIKTHEVYQGPIDIQEELSLDLVPYGCTNLRITCFPRAKL